MKILEIELKEDSPSVILDKIKSKFIISGESFMIDPESFYLPVFKWIDEYLQNPNEETIFEFQINYMNTSSTKVVSTLIAKLKEIKSLKIIWCHYKEDIDNIELGDDISYVTGIPFEFKPIDN